MKKFILYFIISLCFLNCKHNIEDDLLPYSQIGANNITFLLNNTPFNIEHGNYGVKLICSYQRQQKRLTIIGHKENSNEALTIHLTNYTLNLGKIEFVNPEKRAWYDDENNTQHLSTNGYLNIMHIDTLSKIKVLAGTFEVETPKYSISKGRFDIQLSMY